MTQDTEARAITAVEALRFFDTLAKHTHPSIQVARNGAAMAGLERAASEIRAYLTQQAEKEGKS